MSICSQKNNQLPRKIQYSSTRVLWTRPYWVRMDTWTYSSASFWASLWRPIRFYYKVYWDRQEVLTDQSKTVSYNQAEVKWKSLSREKHQSAPLSEWAEWWFSRGGDPTVLTSGSLSRESLSPAQWSALVFILLTSEEELDVFDLKKYSASEEGLLKLLPVVKASKTSL